MSCFMCSDEHISFLAGAAVRYAHVHVLDVEQVAAMLHAANAYSYESRYHRQTTENPEYVRGSFQFRPEAAREVASLVQTIKSAQCYDCQACEFEGYERSDAAKMVRNIISGAIAALPGYDIAAWGGPPTSYLFEVRTLESSTVRIVSTHDTRAEADSVVEWLAFGGFACFVGSVKAASK
jgi:hypothetical protein